MTRILGEKRAHLIMGQLLSTLGVELRDADELFEFANELSKLGGFEGAVGAMLSVQAVMHGAAGDAKPAPAGHARRHV
ncbi:MAG: hypothetical protein WKG01_06600 [Kofleriaceae bacterium]